MKIEITTEFETSHTESYRTVITAKIVTETGVVISTGESRDSWPNPNERRATAKQATKHALERFGQLLNNATDVAEKSGLL